MLTLLTQCDLHRVALCMHHLRMETDEITQSGCSKFSATVLVDSRYKVKGYKGCNRCQDFRHLKE